MCVVTFDTPLVWVDFIMGLDPIMYTRCPRPHKTILRIHFKKLHYVSTFWTPCVFPSQACIEIDYIFM